MAETKAYIKSLKAYDYEYCILGMPDKTCIVISNSEKLTAHLIDPSSDFEPVRLAKKDIEKIHVKHMYQSTQGNYGLVLDGV